MSPRRRFPLPAIASPGARSLRGLPGTLPRAVRGAAALAGVTGFVLTLILTGGHPAGVRTAATERAASLPVQVNGAPVTGATRTATPDVSRALGLFGLSATGARRTPAAAPTRVGRSSVRLPLHRWVRPNWGPLSSGFGYRWGRLHAGIDLAGPYGSTIVAATDGCISYAGPESGYGEVMRISDWDGTQTVYGHMSAFLRHSGCVHAGTPIALVGSGGDATGPHLHFEVRINGVPVNPVPFLARRGVYV